MRIKHLFEGTSFDDIYRELLYNLSFQPQHLCAPRGSKIKENLAVTLVLKDPRARLLSCKKRNTNYGFAVGEFLWYWQGKQDLETMLYYNKRMKDYSDDGETLTSAYGYRMNAELFNMDMNKPFCSGGETSQWKACVQTLKKDPDSRRALMLINWPGDNVHAAFAGSKDVPCTLSLQFFVRNNRLDLHVHMRSNDVMWGLTYDLFSFTLFQECMLLELQKDNLFKDLRLGTYYHTAGSLHLYEQHFQQAEDIVSEYGLAVDYQKPMEPLCDLGDLAEVASIEEALRKGQNVLSLPGDFKSPTAAWMVRQLNDHRTKRDQEARKKNG